MLTISKQRTFRNFLLQVNKKIGNTIGCSIYDLPDFNYADYWDNDCIKYQKEFDYAVDACVDDLIAECEIDSCLTGIKGIDY